MVNLVDILALYKAVTAMKRELIMLYFQDAMGHAVSDINNDGHMDVFLSAIYYSNKSCNLYTCAIGPVGNSLYQYKNKRNFTEIAAKVSKYFSTI